MKCWSFAIGCVSVFAIACSDRAVNPTAPTAGSNGAAGVTATESSQSPAAEQPPFNLEAILRGDGFGLVTFRQQRDSTQNIVTLDVSVRDLLANTSYSLQRATDPTLDGVCTGSNWLTLGEAGHINVESGFGPLPLARRWVHAMGARLARERRPQHAAWVEWSFAV